MIFALTCSAVKLIKAYQINAWLTLFLGFNVGGVSEGGGAEQKAGLQVSLQLPLKSSNSSNGLMNGSQRNKIHYEKSHQINPMLLNAIFQFTFLETNVPCL